MNEHRFEPWTIDIEDIPFIIPADLSREERDILIENFEESFDVTVRIINRLLLQPQEPEQPEPVVKIDPIDLHELTLEKLRDMIQEIYSKRKQ